MTGSLVQFYTAHHEGEVSVLVEIDGAVRYRIGVPDEAAASALIDQMVKAGVESFGGIQTYSREQRN